MKIREHIFALVKAGLNADPHGVGGVIASLLDDYLPSSTERSVKEFTALFEKRLASVEGRIDQGLVTTDEFAELFKSTFLVVMRSHKAERLAAAANILTNGILKAGDDQKLTYTELDHFVRALDSLSIGALRLLGSITPVGATANLQRGERIDFDCLSQMSDFGDVHLLMGLARELEAFNLVEISMPQIRTKDYGNCTIVLTELGKRFATLVLRGEVGR